MAMDSMEEAFGNILNDPQLMQQIMTIAQSLGQKEDPKKAPASGQGSPTPVTPAAPFDAALLQRLGAVMQTGTVDRDQRALLQALSPYLSRDRIIRLEKAMRAARLASAASAFLDSGGLQLLTGR